MEKAPSPQRLRELLPHIPYNYKFQLRYECGRRYLGIYEVKDGKWQKMVTEMLVDELTESAIEDAAKRLANDFEGIRESMLWEETLRDAQS